MNIFKKLWVFVCLETKGLLSDLMTGNLTETEKENFFWLFVILWGLVMVVFFILHEPTGAVFDL
tara:strand:+ start:370 stop:561 length:192 start_codon:yes stop_codon:yes gene_type:complete